MKPSHKITFITGTDTGAGKTVLTALLLAFLRSQGHRALAMKPFCSGSREDAERLQGLQNTTLSGRHQNLPTATLDETNPFYYPEPVAPAASAAPQVTLKTALAKIQKLSKRCDHLLVEGSGGLLVPLGPKFTVRDIISSLNCDVFVACPNKLGVINHTLLTVEALQVVGVESITLFLIETGQKDESSAKNPKIIAKMTPKTRVFEVPNIKFSGNFHREIEKSIKKMKKTLAASMGASYLDLVL